MVTTRDDGTTQVSAAITDDIAKDLERVLDANEEVSQAQLVREGLRRELQVRVLELDDNGDNNNNE
jgi:hypothetical protein